MKFNFVETENFKHLRSPNSNYDFNKKTGYTEMWGKTKEEDIIYSDVGPQILDLEISTICNGYKNNGRCACCYKNDTNSQSQDQNMSLETFKKVLDSLSVDCYELILKNGEIVYATEDVLVVTKRGIVKVKELIELDDILKIIIDDVE